MKAKTIVFITGAFIHHSCWDEWKSYFAGEQCSCVAPPWIYKDAPCAEDLRKRHSDGNSDLAFLSFRELVEYYSKICLQQPEKPIIIGHSLGGLIAQILINRDIGAAGVAIHSFPPRGVLPYEFLFWRSFWSSQNLFFARHETYLLPFANWRRDFTNEISEKAQKTAYDKFVIPESKKVIRGFLASAAKIDFAKAHSPLLLTAGSFDRVIPASMNLRNYKKYRESGSILEFKEFNGRNHFAIRQDGWKMIADYILDWLKTHSLI